jgi:flagellar basal body rod protein FlgB
LFSEEKKLSKYVSHRIQGNNVTLPAELAEEVQYGMDIYTREVATTNGNGNAVDHDSEKHLLTHCCKYLINFSTQARR